MTRNNLWLLAAGGSPTGSAVGPLRLWGQRLLIVGAAVAMAASPAAAAITSIPAMTNPHIVLDFDQMSPGATTVGAVNAAFPGANLVNVSFVNGGANGDYNSSTSGGTALAPGGSGGLQIVAVGDSGYGESTSLTVDLGQASTQFGLALGDYSNSNPGTLEFFDGAVSVGSIAESNPTQQTHYYQSDLPFDRVVFEHVLNWVIPELVVEGVVPEPATAALAACGLLAACWARRRRA